MRRIPTHSRYTKSTIKPLSKVQAMLLWQQQLMKYGWAGPFSYANGRIDNRCTLVGVLKGDDGEFISIEDNAARYLEQIDFGRMPLRVQESLKHYAINREKIIYRSNILKQENKTERRYAATRNPNPGKKDLNNE